MERFFLNSNSCLGAKGGSGSLSGSGRQSIVGYSLEKEKERIDMKSKRNSSNVKKLKSKRVSEWGVKDRS